MTNMAIVYGMATQIDMVRRYLPSNYSAFVWCQDVIIDGTDVAGWTMDDYVIPRLQSGGIYAKRLSQ
jgi:hypothetical protein